VVFKEVRSKSEPGETIQIDNNPEKVCFELRNEEDDLDESTESEEEVEKLTLVVRRSGQIIKPLERYIPPDFYFSFVLTSTNDEPKSVGEEIDSAEEKLWKNTMVKEMKSLHKNETWDLVKLPSGIKHVGRKWYSRRR
jgi:hypothetical protein